MHRLRDLRRGTIGGGVMNAPFHDCPGSYMPVDVGWERCDYCGQLFDRTGEDPGAVPTAENHYGDGPHDEPQDQQ